MKKLLVIFMIMAMLLVAFTSCDKLSELLGGGETPSETPDNGEGNKPDETPHTHDFKVADSKAATCTEDGYTKYECSCGEKKEETATATGHTFKVVDKKTVSCTEDGYVKSACTCGETKEETTPALGHNFQTVEEKAATCTKAGYVNSECANCGEKKEEKLDALGHDFAVVSETPATCNSVGKIQYRCSNCKQKREETFPKLEHKLENVVEQSRLVRCTNDNCSYAKLPEGNGKYKDVLVFKFEESDLDNFYTIFNELDALIKAADPYDATLHAYEEGSDTEAAYLVMEAKYEELYQVMEYVTAQYQLAEIEYCLTMGAAEQYKYNYMSNLRTELVAEFYSFSGAIAESMFREYYYYGMTDDEIKAFILDSDSMADPEYMALSNRNTEIELEFRKIGNGAGSSDRIPELYAEFISNNNKIAAIMGYKNEDGTGNYLAYAYENVYDREYSYKDVNQIYKYVKEYIAPLLKSAYSYNSNMTATGTMSTVYNTYSAQSFFSNYKANDMLNNYIDLLAFTSNPDKQITFSDAFNGLMGDGNLFRGKYSGAFVTTIYGEDIPIAYFGEGSYSASFTVAHEFGHYMNEVYSGGKYAQSYDLLEMHSQGNELVFLAYMKSQLGAEDCALMEVKQLINMMGTIVTALAVDTFEQCIYLDTLVYCDDPANMSDTAMSIMADGTITADEYDVLYKDIISDIGAPGMSSTYWRYVTIGSPCYYISYSISALSVLQLYPKALEDFDAAKDSYLKLFTYIDEYGSEDEYEYMTTEQTLEYAGLYGFTDEELYKYVYGHLITLFE